jgi:hypothetical protein
MADGRASTAALAREITPNTVTQPNGLSLWIGITHYVNLLFLSPLLARYMSFEPDKC